VKPRAVAFVSLASPSFPLPYRRAAGDKFISSRTRSACRADQFAACAVRRSNAFAPRLPGSRPTEAMVIILSLRAIGQAARASHWPVVLEVLEYAQGPGRKQPPTTSSRPLGRQ
jgi:hypothetical protein